MNVLPLGMKTGVSFQNSLLQVFNNLKRNMGDKIETTIN